MCCKTHANHTSSIYSPLAIFDMLLILFNFLMRFSFLLYFSRITFYQKLKTCNRYERSMKSLSTEITLLTTTTNATNSIVQKYKSDISNLSLNQNNVQITRKFTNKSLPFTISDKRLTRGAFVGPNEYLKVMQK